MEDEFLDFEEDKVRSCGPSCSSTSFLRCPLRFFGLGLGLGLGLVGVGFRVRVGVVIMVRVKGKG